MSAHSEIVSGYRTGTWTIDPVHSDVSFTVRHLGVAKVRGHFDTVEGTLVTAENPLESRVEAVIKTESINTRNKQRDDHVRSADFLDVATHPDMVFTSTGIRHDGGDDLLIDGELSLCGVTRPVTLEAEIGGIGEGPGGTPIIGMSAETEINRSDFGVTGGPAGAAVSEKVKISLEIEAALQG